METESIIRERNDQCHGKFKEAKLSFLQQMHAHISMRQLSKVFEYA